MVGCNCRYERITLYLHTTSFCRKLRFLYIEPRHGHEKRVLARRNIQLSHQMPMNYELQWDNLGGKWLGKWTRHSDFTVTWFLSFDLTAKNKGWNCTQPQSQADKHSWLPFMKETFPFQDMVRFRNAPHLQKVRDLDDIHRKKVPHVKQDALDKTSLIYQRTYGEKTCWTFFLVQSTWKSGEQR